MAPALLQPFLNFFKKNKNKKVVIIVHSLGDIDSVGSAFALGSWFKNSYVVMPDTITAGSKKLSKLLNLKFSNFPRTYDLIVVTDTNSAEFLGKFRSKRINCVIDHHSIHSDSIDSDLMLSDNNYTSTCEIVYGLLKALKCEIDRKTATCLAAGIIYDSAQFKTARNRTFKSMHELLAKCKLEYAQLIQLLNVPLDQSQKLALLKSAQRMQILREGNYLIAYSTIGSFESASADSILELGADFAFVGCASEDGRISSRTNVQLGKQVNLASLMNEISKEFGGSGGGHAAAAGANGLPADKLELALKRCVQLTREKLQVIQSGNV